MTKVDIPTTMVVLLGATVAGLAGYTHSEQHRQLQATIMSAADSNHDGRTDLGEITAAYQEMGGSGELCGRHINGDFLSLCKMGRYEWRVTGGSSHLYPSGWQESTLIFVNRSSLDHYLENQGLPPSPRPNGAGL